MKHSNYALINGDGKLVGAGSRNAMISEEELLNKLHETDNIRGHIAIPYNLYELMKGGA